MGFLRQARRQPQRGRPTLRSTRERRCGSLRARGNRHISEGTASAELRKNMHARVVGQRQPSCSTLNSNAVGIAVGGTPHVHDPSCAAACPSPSRHSSWRLRSRSNHPSLGEGHLQRLLVHPGEHQNVAVVDVLSDGCNEPVGVVLDPPTICSSVASRVILSGHRCNYGRARASDNQTGSRSNAMSFTAMVAGRLHYAFGLTHRPR